MDIRERIARLLLGKGIDNFSIKGEVKVDLVDKYGNIKDSEVCNKVVIDGKTFIISLMMNENPATLQYIAIGIGTGETLDDDSALHGEEKYRKLASKESSGVTITFTSNFGAAEGEGIITEALISNGATVGTGIMFCRAVFGGKDKGPTDSLNFTWTITIQ